MVLSDLVPTTGDAAAVAGELAAEGIAVDVVMVGGDRSADAVLDGVEAPATARRGDQVPVTISVRSTDGGPAELVVDAGGGDGTNARSFAGRMDEIRVSAVARYTANFDPLARLG